jgi:hypothetical protein
VPIDFTVGEAIKLLEYGKFTLLTLSGVIPASEAVEITETPSLKPPAVEAVYHIEPGWVVLTERFNWGETSRPDKVYYELWQYGKVFKTAYPEGFYCGGFVRGSNVENVCTHIFASERIHVKLWNATGRRPEDVYFDFTVWYYTYRVEFHERVMEIITRTWTLLEELLGEIRELKACLRGLAGRVGELERRVEVVEKRLNYPRAVIRG